MSTPLPTSMSAQKKISTFFSPKCNADKVCEPAQPKISKFFSPRLDDGIANSTAAAPVRAAKITPPNSSGKKNELRSRRAEEPPNLPQGKKEQVPPSKGKSSQGQKRKLKPQVTSGRRRVVLSDEEKDEDEKEQESDSDYIAEDDDDTNMDTSGEEVSDLDQENSDEDDDDHQIGKTVGAKKKRGAVKATMAQSQPRKRAATAGSQKPVLPTAESVDQMELGGKNRGLSVSAPRVGSPVLAAVSAAHLTPSPLPERVGSTSLAATATATATPLPGTMAPAAVAPQPGARIALHKAFNVDATVSKPSGTAVPELVHGIHTNVNSVSGEASRFLARMAQRFPFLHPDQIMDAKMRRPGQEDYDPGTLYISPSWFKENKVSEGQQQWWLFKAANFGSVLLFKMGKFYEMFEMDAYVGVDVLGLIFMKGEQPHAGFPEVRYHYMAETLARAGYRVVVVEQTETPEQLARRNAELKSKNQKQCGVVRREKVAVLSRGTLIDAEMVQSRPDASYILAVCEQLLPTPHNSEHSSSSLPPPPVVTIGLCAVDVASGHILVGQFNDDEIRSTLRTQLACLQPVELVLPPPAASATRLDASSAAGLDASGLPSSSMGGADSQATLQALAASPGQPIKNIMRGDRSVWTPQGALQVIEAGGYFKALGFTPPVWEMLNKESVRGGWNLPLALSVLGGMTAYLKELLLDRAVLPLGGLELLPGVGDDLPIMKEDGKASSVVPAAHEPTCMMLNGAALENLEVLENAEGGTQGTLVSVMDHCATPFGRRRLKQWLCRPLFRVQDITQRQDAVALLMTYLSEASGRARKKLSSVSDLERSLARMQASTVAGAGGRDAGHVVLYEDQAKRRVKALVGAIKDLQDVRKAVANLRDPEADLTRAPLLQRLTKEQYSTAEEAGASDASCHCWAKVGASLDTLNLAADWQEAERSGRVVPSKGIDSGYDSACDAIAASELALQRYLVEFKRGCPASGKGVSYISVLKDSHVLEVPDTVTVPKDFDLVSQKKGFKRYMSPALRSLVTQLDDAKECKEAALSGILHGLISKFTSEGALWSWAVNCVAELDALMSLAAHAMGSETTMCRPVLLSYHEEMCEGRAPVFEATNLIHPSGLSGRGGTFVPNDISLGGEQPSFIVLTGPNMGGKSTMLRQTCLAALMAQVGAWVPATSLRLHPVDAIFVRMGARDHIMAGQSTFYVELAETAAMLHKATRRSLVALDELGRGTATLDGAAIAGAVLEHMTQNVGCRGMFATHYHHLSEQHAHDPHVAVMHMACAVGCAIQEEGSSWAAGCAIQEEGSSRAALIGGRTTSTLSTKIGEPLDGISGDFCTSSVEEVTFLYKLRIGACPRSYGTNVARLAGLPERVVKRAAYISLAKELEDRDYEESGGAGHSHVPRDKINGAHNFEASSLVPEEGKEMSGRKHLAKTMEMVVDGLKAALEGNECEIEDELTKLKMLVSSELE
ncbi:hypothetical protein CEUSTIGMA_g3355.t1 [Chlamydomonas eustigma]|uniref:DNA mismatch repair protein n=1 Tax=Chlamydomonas eustigma TaxID=1157962 RepID=A0A250WZ69_9CHLO|nr:hypothetical protein CEUSTIGMA_g3355.t1 [Chlamydomonas eustigma]|eukprot:GAX75912.1 hypothetical protein CEUSTIGMA_g3355.t1 [Chlamydomonas eustigma]